MQNNLEFISYTGKWPNLCNGVLTIKLGEITYELDNILITSGSAYFTNDYSDSHIETGEWSIDVDDLPAELRDCVDAITDLVNENVEHGCCGGCL